VSNYNQMAASRRELLVDGAEVANPIFWNGIVVSKRILFPTRAKEGTR
jgi:hypothetical protein